MAQSNTTTLRNAFPVIRLEIQRRVSTDIGRQPELFHWDLNVRQILFCIVSQV